MAFRGQTDDNGTTIDITGNAADNGFVIQSPRGTVTAPPQVHPSNPWALSVLHTDFLMSTKDGRVVSVVVTDTGEANITLDGKTSALRQYFIDSDKHQVVWFDATGVPVGFQTTDGGNLLNFVLMGRGFFLP